MARWRVGASAHPIGKGDRVTSSVVDVWRSRSVLRFLVRRDLAIKYQQSVLGYVWSLIEPLMMGAIYWFVFGVLYGGSRAGPEGSGPPYIVYLLAGIFAFMWITGVLTEATSALTSQKALITTMNVPREVFPVGRVLARFWEFAAGLPILLVIILVINAFAGPDEQTKFGWTLLAIPLAVVLQAIFLVGIALLLSSINVMLRDVERFMRLVQRFVFYGTPIIYPMERVEENLGRWVWVYKSNPLVGILELHHSAWYPQTFPSATLLAVCTAGCLVTFVVGWLVFRRLEPAVLKEL
jgi:ABC-2 type transport system permease protein